MPSPFDLNNYLGEVFLLAYKVLYNQLLKFQRLIHSAGQRLQNYNFYPSIPGSREKTGQSLSDRLLLGFFVYSMSFETVLGGNSTRNTDSGQ